MPKTNLKPKARARSRQRMVRLRSDLQWCYDRLSHLLFIFEKPESVQAGFGPSETMSILADNLPKLRAMHNLSDCYEHKQPNIQVQRPPIMSNKFKQRPRAASLQRGVSRGLTLQQKLMLCDAAKDGGSYQCVSREFQVGRNLYRKGLGSMWHDVFEINDAGRAAVGLPPPNAPDERPGAN